jgi:hypothetical protein
MKLKLGERDATLYYEEIDYSAYQDVTRSKKADLEKFFQELTNDPLLRQQFESITHREQFINLAIRLGAGRGYTFTVSELEDVIEASTASGQGEYFCLPIGCWHKAESA